jgi:hypothetical protein
MLLSTHVYAFNAYLTSLDTKVALRAVVLQPVGVSAGRRDWLVVSTILPQAPGPKCGW